MSEQRSLLQESKTRKDIGLMKLDSASLFVHRDSSSFISRWSDNLSKISLCFGFDRELFGTRVYERVFRGAVKASIRKLGGHKFEENSGFITRIQRNPWRGRELQSVFLLGNDQKGKQKMIETVKSFRPDGYTGDELASYRYHIYQNIVDYAKELVQAIKLFDNGPDSEGRYSCYDFLLAYRVRPDRNTLLEHTVIEAIEALREDPFIEKALNSSYVSDFRDTAL